MINAFVWVEGRDTKEREFHILSTKDSSWYTVGNLQIFVEQNMP
jgi:hypothetical protein